MVIFLSDKNAEVYSDVVLSCMLLQSQVTGKHQVKVRTPPIWKRGTIVCIVLMCSVLQFLVSILNHVTLLVIQ